MPDKKQQRTQLPPVTVPPEVMRLLMDMRYELRSESLSALIRELLMESPRFRQYAESKGVDLNDVDVSGWGGKREAGHVAKID